MFVHSPFRQSGMMLTRLWLSCVALATVVAGADARCDGDSCVASVALLQSDFSIEDIEDAPALATGRKTALLYGEGVSPLAHNVSSLTALAGHISAPVSAPAGFQLLGSGHTAWRLIANSVGQRLGLCQNCDTNEEIHLILLLAFLCLAMLLSALALLLLREVKSDQVLPLCPQLIVRGSELVFDLSREDGMSDTIAHALAAVNQSGVTFCRLITEQPVSDVDGCKVWVVKLQNKHGHTLASIVFRSTAMTTGIAIAKASSELFGFVDFVPGERKFVVRHRNSTHLLALHGTFGVSEVIAKTNCGTNVAWIPAARMGAIQGVRVADTVDVGLLLLSLYATSVCRQVAFMRDSGPTAVPPKISQMLRMNVATVGSDLDEAEVQTSVNVGSSGVKNLPLDLAGRSCHIQVDVNRSMPFTEDATHETAHVAVAEPSDESRVDV